ncbi:MAG: hypothetical protein U5L11_16190 [Arhodomonas sp.]|nr:hypothetical protein [Arhodomonas sp.]
MYVLSLAGGAAGADVAAAAGPFVPGEIVLRLRPGMSLPPGEALRRLGGGNDAPMLLRLGDPGSGAALQRLGVEASGAGRLATLRAVARLRRHPGVRYAEPNYIWERRRIPNDPRYPEQWHYPGTRLANGLGLGYRYRRRRYRGGGG